MKFFKTSKSKNLDQAKLSRANRRLLIRFQRPASLALAMGISFLARQRVIRRLKDALQASARADEARRRLQAIADAASISIVYVDQDERFIFANRYHLERYGKVDSDGKTIREVISDEAYTKIAPHIRKVLSGSTVSFDTTVERPGLPIIQVKATYSPIYDRNHAIMGFVSVSEDVTEINKAAQALKSSRQSLALALQSAEMGTWEFDIESQVSNQSPETLQILGIAPEEWDSTIETVMSRIHPDDRARFESEIRKCIADGSPLESEHRILLKSGQKRWVLTRGRCVRENASGRPQKFAGLVYDISERKEREAKNAFLLKSVSAFSKALTPKELLATTIDLCAEAFGSDSGMLAVANQAGTHLCFVSGKSDSPNVSLVHELSGISIESDSVAAQTFRSRKPAFISSRSERETVYPEAIDSDPEPDLEAFAYLPLLFEGRAIGLLGIGFKNKRVMSEADKRAFIAMGDLAAQALERSQLYEQMKVERDQYRAVFELSGNGAAEIDLATDRFIRVNHRFSEIIGYSEEELREMTLIQLNPIEEREKTSSAYEQLKKGPDSSWRIEKRYIKKDGSNCWVICSGTMLRDAEGLAVRGLVTFFDVTDLKETERALTEAVKSRDQFLSIASHELKTPLTSLQLQIQLRQRDLKRKYRDGIPSGKMDAFLDEQYNCVNRISRLVDDILDVSRIAVGKLVFQMSEFDLCEMVSDVIARFKITADPSGIEIRFDGCEPVHGKWDRFRIEQVLLNLLSNAVKYGNKSPVHVEVSRRGSDAILSVKDEGMGIKPEDQARIFQRFERAISENEVSGLGLGLYISKEIAIAHGGDIQVRSELGKGAEFIVSLPQQFFAKEK